MGNLGSNYKVRLPGSPEPGSPLVIADTVDLTAWSDNSRPAGTRNYLGVGINARLHSISKPAPTASTLTLRGPEDDMNFFIREARRIGCEQPVQRVLVCDSGVESGEVYRLASFNTQTKEGVTTNGINVTDNPSEIIQETEWEGPAVHWDPPQQSLPAVYSNSGGFNFEVPSGTIDGTNTVFRLSPEPVDPNLVVVFLNAVEQTVSVDYTLDGDTITFVVAPACGDALLVYWTDSQSVINGLFPVAVAFCDAPSCGGGSCASKFSNGCRTFLALYQTPTSVEGCSTGELLTAALARYTLTRDGSVMLEDVNLMANVVRPKGMVCIDNQVVIAGAFGTFFACSGLGTGGCTCDCSIGSIVAVQAASPVTLNEVEALAGAKGTTQTFYYALHGVSGVIRSSNSRQWEISIPDGQFSIAQQHLITAKGDIVVTAGDSNDMQISRANGKSGSWTACVGPGAAADNIIGLCVDLASLDQSYALIYVVTADPAYAVGTLWITNDFGQSWESRQSWSLADFAVGTQTSPAFNQNVINCAVDGSWVYLHYLTTTQRNVNFGLDCDWQSISSNEIQYPQNVIALCPSNPRTLIVVEQGLVFADEFDGAVEADITNHVPFFDQAGNGWVVQAGTVGTNGTQASFTAGGITTTDIELADVTIRADVVPLAAGTGTGIVFRLTDATNYWMAIVDEAADTFKIVEVVAGVPTVQATTPVTVTAGDIYSISLNVTDQVATATVNLGNQLIYTSVLTGAGETEHGIVGVTGDLVNLFQIS